MRPFFPSSHPSIHVPISSLLRTRLDALSFSGFLPLETRMYLETRKNHTLPHKAHAPPFLLSPAFFTTASSSTSVPWSKSHSSSSSSSASPSSSTKLQLISHSSYYHNHSLPTRINLERPHRVASVQRTSSASSFFPSPSPPLHWDWTHSFV